MYVAVQRIVGRRKQGINAFLHLHGAMEWPRRPVTLSDRAPGALKRRRVVVPPGDNRVVSYLDVVAPDGTPRSVISELLDRVRPFAERSEASAGWLYGPLSVGFGVDLELDDYRADEFDALVRAARAILRPRRVRR